MEVNQEPISEMHERGTASKRNPEEPKPKEKFTPDSTDVQENPRRYLNGLRLYFLTTGLCLSLFLSSLDITIVSTSLTSIVKDLHDFEQSSWIISSYLVTYFSFIIIWAKLSDILGRKVFLGGAIALFVVFSGACGGGQTVLQVVIFRAIQGIGGAGIFSLTPVIVSEMVPTEKFGRYNAIASTVIGISFLLGPLLGGAINDHTSWRWIFLINIPVGIVAFVMVLVTMPAHFPNNEDSPRSQSVFRDASQRIDFPGFLMFLSACVLLICALEEAGTAFAWSSPLIITLITLSGVLWVLFFIWQRRIGHQDTLIEAVLPWRFFKNRVLMGIYLNALLSGVPFTVVVIELPQKFQIVNETSALNAGVRLLPFSLSCALGSAVIGVFTSGLKVPPIFVVLVGGILQTVGMALSFAQKVSLRVPASFYGFEAIAGFGVGLSLTTLLGFAPFVVKNSDRAVAMGGVTQLRVLGGTLGVSIGTNLLNNHVRKSMSSFLPEKQLDAFLQAPQIIGSLETTVQTSARIAFAEGYNMQMGMILGFAAAEFISIVLMWQKKPIRVA